MDEALKKALEKLIEQGPLGICLVIFIYLYIKSLKKQDEITKSKDELVEKVIELGQASVKSDTEVKAALGQVTKDLDGVREDLRDRS